VLVVDDNQDSAQSMAALLEIDGHLTRTAGDGVEALRIADTWQPDAFLLDIGLPGLNGYEVARQIRERPWGEHVLLIALTGWGEEEKRRRSLDAGFDGHLVKPADYDSIVRLLNGSDRRSGAMRG
jgi:CheY-like chemotaxis protein